MNYYILIGKKPTPVNCIHTWGQWFEWNSRNGGRHVAQDTYPARKPLRKQPRSKRSNRGVMHRINVERAQEVWVSTVFLGLDHDFNFFGMINEHPVIFETLVFGGRHDGLMRRYREWDDAAEGHKMMCKEIRSAS